VVQDNNSGGAPSLQMAAALSCSGSDTDCGRMRGRWPATVKFVAQSVEQRYLRIIDRD
jgi:hypothetical protein